MSGDGLFVLRVQIRTGVVKDVQINSIGWSILDSTAKHKLAQWRFMPSAQNLPPIAAVFSNSKDRFAREDAFVEVPVDLLEFGGRTASAPAAHAYRRDV